MNTGILGNRGYRYMPGELVQYRAQEWNIGQSRFSVMEVRGDKLLIATGMGPCLLPAEEFEPLKIDPRRVIDNEDLTVG